jgi:hypothetical protein
MDVQAVTGPKALAPRASGPSHILGLKGWVGSMLGSSPMRETVWGLPTVPTRCDVPTPWSCARRHARRQWTNGQSFVWSLLEWGGVRGGHAGQGFGAENLPRRVVHGEAAAAGDVLVRGIRWSAMTPRWSYNTMETIGVWGPKEIDEKWSEGNAHRGWAAAAVLHPNMVRWADLRRWGGGGSGHKVARRVGGGDSELRVRESRGWRRIDKGFGGRGRRLLRWSREEMEREYRRGPAWHTLWSG